MRTGARKPTFGIKTSQINLGYEEILRVWREADDVGVFEHAWLWDHMVPLRGDVNSATLEAWTLLSALAAQAATKQQTSSNVPTRSTKSEGNN